MIVRELLIAIGFDIDDSKLDAVNTKINQLGKSTKTTDKPVKKLEHDLTKLGTTGAESTARAAEGMADLERRTKLSEKALKQKRGEMGKFKQEGAGLLSTILGIAGGFASMAAAAVGGRWLLGTISQFQQLRAQLVTIEQDEAKAEAAFSRLQQFATTTPFQLENVVASFARLRAVGLDPTNADLMAMGDIAAGMGKDIMEFADAVVGATTGEMERLKQFGIVARQQGNNVTFLFKGQEVTMKKTAENISQYLYQLGRENFAGGMERQAATISGAFSNLMDNLAAFADLVGKAGLAKEINLLIRELTGMAGESENIAVILGQSLGWAVRQVTDAIRWLKENATLVNQVLATLGTLLAAGAVVKGLTWLMSTMRAIAAAASLASLKIGLITLAVALLGLAVEDIMGFFDGKESIIGTFLEDVFGLKGPEAAEKLKMALVGIGIAVLSVLAILKAPLVLIAGLIAAGVALIANWDLVKQSFINAGTELYNFIGNLFGLILLTIYGTFDKIGVAIGEFAGSMWMPIENTWQSTIARITAIWDRFKTGVAEGIKSIIDTITSVPQLIAKVPALGRVLQAGGIAADFLSPGAMNPGIDQQRRMNEITNNKQSRASIQAPITLQVNTSGGAESGGLVADVERQLSGMVRSIFEQAAADFEGALE